MEVVLDTYAEPADRRVPLVCCDELGKALQAHARAPLPAQPGPPAREDPEYVRHGSANLFLSYAPHLGWRQVTVTAQRTAVDWALAMRDLVDTPQFADAARIIVVLDNLNTHRLSSLYTAFPAPEARRIPDQATLATEVAAWADARNAVAAPAQWTFTTEDARTRLTHLYPIPVRDTSM